MRYSILLIYLLLYLGSTLRLAAQQPKHFFSTNFSTRTGFASANSVGLSNNLSNIGLKITDDTNVFDMQVEPVYGFFVSPHWLLGCGLVFEVNNSEFFNDVVTRELLTFYPFARYYVKPIAREVKNQFFIEASYSRFLFFQEPQFNRSGASAGIGLTQFLKNNIGLDVKLSFNKDQFDNWKGGRLQTDATLNVFLNHKGQNNRGGQRKISSGTWMIGASDLLLSASGKENRRDRNFNLQLKSLRFFSDRLATGAGLRFGMLRRRAFINTPSASFHAKVNNFSFDFQPQLRYYLSRPQHIMFFATVGIGIHYELETIDKRTQQLIALDTPLKDFFIDTGVGLGANVFLSPDLAFEFGPNLQFGLEQKRMRFGIDAGISFFFNKNVN